MVPVVATISSGADINEISESDFKLFPNPNSGSFDIQLSNNNILEWHIANYEYAR